VRLDSVRIQNLTRSWTETIVYPDTVLSFTKTGITDAQGVAAEVVSYPNPFNGTTNLSVSMPQSGDALVQVYDLAGQKVAERAMMLEAGRSLFEVRLQHSQVYLLSVTTPQGRSTIKLLNRGASAENSIAFFGAGTVAEKLYCTKPFQIGDQMKMFGYVTHNGYLVTSNVVQQTQSVSENFTLIFALSSADVPKVFTDSVIRISNDTAFSGGLVASDGGSPVTARGVCWDTLQNPTVAGSHTNDGTGVGSFSSTIAHILQGKTYYIRAYATNSSGTGYGDQVSFTTSVFDANKCFSVAPGHKVIFSPGNLQWSATGGGSTLTTHSTVDGIAAGTWRFAEHQWDYIGAPNANVSPSYIGWIDLFGIGTSGYDSIFPYDTIISNSNYLPYATMVGTKYDWGVYNAIYNPQTRTTDSAGVWRTLTWYEFEYLIDTRNTTSGIRYAKATVNNVPGLVIVPDNWRTSTYTLNSTNSQQASYNSNVISAANWSICENAGCVFLPAGGHRTIDGVTYIGVRGSYWSAMNSHSLFFDASNYVTIIGTGNFNGYFVRLAREATLNSNPQLPTIVTDTTVSILINVNNTIATIGGTVVSDGGSHVILRGVCFDTVPNTTIYGPILYVSGGTGNFSVYPNNLVSGTTYYFRAFATNSVGTAYGNQVVFTVP
ncbi:MAG: T9SS type A sorting domain-containing protein, partial [Bacteroidales bacterium]|nr:T9SS type A sorting domain-containing protein [Bacteroidales bacterium]